MAKRMIMLTVSALTLAAFQYFAVNQFALGQGKTDHTEQPATVTATFNKIPDQPYVDGLFLVTVTVRDESGHAVPGAHVVISLDPQYIGNRRKVTLRDAAGDIVSEMNGDTGADAKVPFWVRLSGSDLPFKARLKGSVEAPKHGALNFQSNEFQVFSPDNYSDW
jgi:hypothetical protein